MELPSSGCFQNAVPPPVYTAWLLDQAAPGVWPYFIGRAFRALDQIGPWTATSWWRTPSQNRRVGGSPDSQHLVGSAVDLCSTDNNLLERLLDQTGLIAVNEGDHVHVQVFAAGMLRASGVLARIGV